MFNFWCVFCLLYPDPSPPKIRIRISISAITNYRFIFSFYSPTSNQPSTSLKLKTKVETKGPLGGHTLFFLESYAFKRSVAFHTVALPIDHLHSAFAFISHRLAPLSFSMLPRKFKNVIHRLLPSLRPHPIHISSPTFSLESQPANGPVPMGGGQRRRALPVFPGLGRGKGTK